MMRSGRLLQSPNGRPMLPRIFHPIVSSTIAS
jgi:hypothetical protein